MKISPIEVTLIDHCGSDLSVVNAARVSFHKKSEWEYTYVKDVYEPMLPVSQHLSDKDQKLISYLAKHNHKSPFNHAFLSFRVKAPIFVARQLVKHEYLPWNEVSRRYVDDEPEFYFPNKWRARADNVKQGSSDKELEMSYPDCDLGMWIESQTAEQLSLYNKCLKVGMCPEQARMVLPLNTITEWLWSGTLFAFVKMCKLRLDPHTQLETQEVAQKIAKYVKELFPVSYQELMKV